MKRRRVYGMALLYSWAEGLISDLGIASRRSRSRVGLRDVVGLQLDDAPIRQLGPDRRLAGRFEERALANAAHVDVNEGDAAIVSVSSEKPRTHLVTPPAACWKAEPASGP